MNSNFPIETQTSTRDQETLITIKNCVTDALESYNYCEIGSFKGGSLVPHLREKKCATVVSIDARKTVQNDDRGEKFVYIGNTAERMVQNLENIHSAAELQKLQTCTGTMQEAVASAAMQELGKKFHLFFIDGEHTHEQCIKDFESCWRVKADQAVFVFHDASTIAEAIEQLLTKEFTVPIVAYPLPDDIFVIEAGLYLHLNTRMYLYQREKGHEAYFHALKMQKKYRNFYNKFKPLRTLIKVLQGRNVFWTA